MAPPKPIAPPSPSSSGSASESASSSDEEQKQHQQQQRQQKMSPAKTSPPPPKKKPVVPKKKQRTPVAEEEQQRQPKTKSRQPTASPPPLKKKLVLNDTRKPPPPAPRSAAAPAAAAADSGSDEDSDSPSAAMPSPPLPRLRVPDPSSSTEPVSSSKPELPPPAAASQQLRADKKRKRKQQEVAGDAQERDADANAAAGGPSSKKLFQRVWTEEDEIALLQGMLDFQEKDGGAHLALDIYAFVAFVSAALRGGFTKSQIYEKVRRLRKKYVGNLRRGKEGVDPSFAKPHEQVVFELSKRIWPAGEGDSHYYGGDDKVLKTKDKGGKTGSQRVGLLYPMLAEAINLFEKEDDNNFLARSISRALGSLKPSKAKTLEDQWSKHFIAGAKYFLERTRLKKDLLESIAKVLDSE